MKVYLEPIFRKPDTGDGGIRRVVEAQRKYLPQFGIEVVTESVQADITVGHGTLTPIVPGKPFVSCNHGAYWSEYNWEGKWAYDTNARLVRALTAATAITVPSQWVKGALARGILKSVTVIPHGVDLDDWTPGRSEGYVLWNKARRDPVSDPADMNRLAGMLPDVQFISTIGAGKNIRNCGLLPYQEMKTLIQNAGVYLATARETFGIGTLEAMASGVPVAGWRYGGQVEIVQEGDTGYLAEYGNYAELTDAVRRCLRERERLGKNAREDVRLRWGWAGKIERYAQLFLQVYEQASVVEVPTVSVIITCHNLARFLGEALKSVLAQTFRDWECIIVDDDSTDNPLAVAEALWDSRFHYVRTDGNLKLSRARNFGVDHSMGRFIINLDADDKLPTYALGVLVEGLERDPGIHIVYGGLELMNDDGSNVRPNPWPGDFNWYAQIAHLNQLPYAALMRREVLTETGGYRERQWRAEDAEFWTRVTSFGYRAEKVTQQPTLTYRLRADSKGALERKKFSDVDGNWCEGFPWSLAWNATEGKKAIENNAKIRLPHLVPFSAQGQRKDGSAWDISHRQDPLVSVIIPLGPGHRRYVIDALDSLIAQTFGNWEVVVVDDSGEKIESIPGAPYARIFQTAGGEGPGVARNIGLERARGPLCLFLDADDILQPDAINAMLLEYRKGQGGYVYSGWRVVGPAGEIIEMPAKPYDRMAWLRGKADGRNIVTVLMATEDARRIRFDEHLAAYEDWDFFIRCAVQGCCGVPVTEFLATYRTFAGERSLAAKPIHVELRQTLFDRYAAYREGREQMAPCRGGCAEALKRIREARGLVTATTAKQPVPEGRVRMQFVGERLAPVIYHANGHPYAGGLMEDYRFVDALSDDVGRLEGMGVWRRARVEVEQVVVISRPPAAPQPPAALLAPEPARPEPLVIPIAAVIETVKVAVPENGHASQQEAPAVAALPPAARQSKKAKRSRK